MHDSACAASPLNRAQKKLLSTTVSVARELLYLVPPTFSLTILLSSIAEASVPILLMSTASHEHGWSVDASVAVVI